MTYPRAVRWGAMPRVLVPPAADGGVPAAAGAPTAVKPGPAFEAGIQAGLDALRAKQKQAAKRKEALAKTAEARGHSRW